MKDGIVKPGSKNNTVINLHRVFIVICFFNNNYINYLFYMTIKNEGNIRVMNIIE